MKTRPLTAMGLDWFLSEVALASTPGNDTFHSTLASSLPPQVNGKSFSSQTPWPVGPRHDGQSAAAVVATTRIKLNSASSTRRMAIEWSSHVDMTRRKALKIDKDSSAF